MKIKAYIGDKSIELLTSEKYPLALGEDGNVYRFAKELKRSRWLTYEIYVSDNPRLEFRAECDGKIHYVDINPEFWRLANSYEQYMILHNCGNHTPEEVMCRLSDIVKERPYYDINKVITVHKNEYGEFIATCKVIERMYFIRKKTMRDFMVYLIKDGNDYKIDLHSGVENDKRAKTYTEKQKFYDENAPRSIYIDLPLLVDPDGE